MKNIFMPALLLCLSAGFFGLQSCQKKGTLTGLPAEPVSVSGKNSSGGGGTGGGGTSGGGHNGGSGGGTAVTPPTPTDTVTSQLPVAEIITVGKWKVSSFVQGNDNLSSDFAPYTFTFNSDGTMIADDNSTQSIGSWHYQDAIFYYGIPVYGSSPYGFTMTIGSGFPLTSLNENYFISKKTLTTIYIDSINPSENAHIVLSKL